MEYLGTRLVRNSSEINFSVADKKLGVPNYSIESDGKGEGARGGYLGMKV